MKRRVTIFFLLLLYATSLSSAQELASNVSRTALKSEGYQYALSDILFVEPSGVISLNNITGSVLYTTFLGVLVLLLFTIVMFVKHKKAQLANKELLAKNIEIQRKNKALKQLHRQSEAQHVEIADQQRELEEMNLIKDKMFSIIAHDFRSPLNTIQGVLNLLHLDVLSTEELKSMLPQLSRKVNHSINLLDNLLNWARTQMNGLKINKIDFTLLPEIEETMGLTSQLANQKNIRIENSIDQSSRVYADPDMIQLVVRNLLFNAIKFTNNGGIIRISAQQENNSVVIAVSDTGVGMEDSYVQQLFQHVGNSTRGTDQEKGTGLGLVLCDEFIRRNNGKIWVESKKDEGTTFYFTLPSATVLETPSCS